MSDSGQALGWCGVPGRRTSLDNSHYPNTVDEQLSPTVSALLTVTYAVKGETEIRASTQQAGPDQLVEDAWLRLYPLTRCRMQECSAVLSRQILEVINWIVGVAPPELLDQPLGLATQLHAGILRRLAAVVLR